MPKGPKVLREINEKRVLGFLRVQRTSSRQEITEALDLSKNTVSLIIDKFIQEGIVQEIGMDSSGVGRPRTQLGIVPDVWQSVGLMVRDASCELVVTDYFGSIIDSEQLVMNTQDTEIFFHELARLWARLMNQHPDILGVGIAVPGLVDPVHGFVHYSSHLGWRSVPLLDILSKKIPVPIYVLNRVKAAALSPVQIIPEGAHSTFYIRIDEGVGGAFVVGNDIVHGYSYTAGEVGHIVVQSENGPLCTCGQRGCLESLVSVPQVFRSLGIPLPSNYLDTHITDLLKRINTETKTRIEEFQILMSDVGTYVGVALSTIINLFNPQYIVIDSPYNSLNSFKSATLSTVASRALRHPFDHTEVVFAEKSVSSAWGMAFLVIHQFETAPFGTSN